MFILSAILSINGSVLECENEELHNAVRASDYSTIFHMIRNGTDMYAEDCHGLIPMFYIFDLRIETEVDIISFFLDGGFDVNHKSAERLLFTAVQKGEYVVLEKFLKYGAIVDIEIKGPKGSYTPLLVALHKRDETSARKLLKYGANIRKKLETSNYTDYMTELIKSGELDSVILLQTLGFNMTSTPDWMKYVKTAISVNRPVMVNVLARFIEWSKCLEYQDQWADTLNFAVNNKHDLALDTITRHLYWNGCLFKKHSNTLDDRFVSIHKKVFENNSQNSTRTT